MAPVSVLFRPVVRPHRAMANSARLQPPFSKPCKLVTAPIVLPSLAQSLQPSIVPPNLEQSPTVLPNLPECCPAPSRNLITYRATKSAAESPNQFHNPHPLTATPSSIQHFNTGFAYPYFYCGSLTFFAAREVLEEFTRPWSQKGWFRL